MKGRETTIWVYADWKPVGEPELMGILTSLRVRGKEVFSFKYDETWLKVSHQALFLDPGLRFYKGKQHLQEEKPNFGVFLDSAPDRWGRLLMRRREAWQARRESRPERTLLESDFLLGVFDGHRLGGLRFRLNPDGAFMNDQKQMATPPWTSLRELEHACLQLEREDAIHDPEYARWLSLLIDPGSSWEGQDQRQVLLMNKVTCGSQNFRARRMRRMSGRGKWCCTSWQRHAEFRFPRRGCRSFRGSTTRFCPNDLTERTTTGAFTMRQP